MKTRKLRAVSAILLSIIMLATTFSAAFAARPESTDLTNVDYYGDWSFYPEQKRFSYTTAYTYAIQIILHYCNERVSTTLGTVDGKYGPSTHAAVLIFQQQQNLTETGIVNDVTWQALRNQLIAVNASETRGASAVLPDDGYAYMRVVSSNLWSFRYNPTTHTWQYNPVPVAGAGIAKNWHTFYSGK